MGWRSAVHPLCSAVVAAAVGTVGCAAAVLRCPAGPAAADTGAFRRWSPFRGTVQRFRPARHNNCLPGFVTPALLACAFQWPPFRGCQLLPCLLFAMIVFPLFLHIFIHVLYLTCFHHPCVLTRLTRVYPVSDYVPMSPGISCPVFLSHFVVTS